MDEAGWRRVGARIDAERARRGYSLVGFARATGVGKSTIDKLVHARRMSYDPATIAAIEAGLGWMPGSIQRILEGMEPVEDHDPDLRTLLDAWPRLSPQSRAMIRAMVTEALKRD